MFITEQFAFYKVPLELSSVRHLGLLSAILRFASALHGK